MCFQLHSLNNDWSDMLGVYKEYIHFNELITKLIFKTLCFSRSEKGIVQNNLTFSFYCFDMLKNPEEAHF